MTPDQRERIISRDFWTCQRCGATPDPSRLQVAHRMHQGKSTEKYINKILIREHGEYKTMTWIRNNIVDHPLNCVTTCSLECNGSFNVLFKPVECKKVLDSILEDLNIKQKGE